MPAAPEFTFLKAVLLAQCGNVFYSMIKFIPPNLRNGLFFYGYVLEHNHSGHKMMKRLLMLKGV
jgi:hypothetical protein